MADPELRGPVRTGTGTSPRSGGVEASNPLQERLQLRELVVCQRVGVEVHDVVADIANRTQRIEEYETVHLPTHLARNCQMDTGATSRDSRAGYTFYRDAGGAIDKEDLNRQLSRLGTDPSPTG